MLRLFLGISREPTPVTATTELVEAGDGDGREVGHC